MSHGTGGSPWTYRGMAAHLARAGFVVALPEHPGNNRSAACTTRPSPTCPSTACAPWSSASPNSSASSPSSASASDFYEGMPLHTRCTKSSAFLSASECPWSYFGITTCSDRRDQSQP
ncbi:MAG: hypothetical protein ACJ8AT_36315 [Hyalangium sp.]|uniref:alpha/beta hydrolase n=1 Tax=Hyalangium sp. TaxID=2028555 RepID=UPI00389B0CC1